jgi:hypothetical protein
MDVREGKHLASQKYDDVDDDVLPITTFSQIYFNKLASSNVSTLLNILKSYGMYVWKLMCVAGRRQSSKRRIFHHSQMSHS